MYAKHNVVPHQNYANVSRVLAGSLAVQERKEGDGRIGAYSLKCKIRLLVYVRFVSHCA